MSFKISNILEYDNFIALDIGTFKVKVAICKIENGEIKIISKTSLRQNKKDFIFGEIADLNSVSKSVEKAILKASANLESIPNDVIVGFSNGQEVYDHISTNYVRQSKETPITMEEIDDIIKGIEYKSLDKVRTKIEQRLGIAYSEMKLISTSLISIYIDGQRVSNPVGFSGKNIKLNLINIFAPTGKFNIIKKIINGIDKNLISIIPVGISIPKLIEDTPYAFDYNMYIDFGYSKTIVTIENKSEILGFNVINFGLEILEEEFKKNFELNYFDIENIMAEIDSNYEKYKEIYDSFFDLIFDAITVASQDIEKNLFIKNMFLSGASVSETLKTKLKSYFEKKGFGKGILVVDKFIENKELLELNNGSESVLASIAKVGKEILNIKKDPIVRILRYIIYRYE